jgi:hypothetical protein
MKRIALFFFILSLSFHAIGQKTDFFSVELNTSYYRYILRNTYSQDFNYGFSLAVNRHVNRAVIGIGINFSTKSFWNDGDTFFIIEKYDYSINYLNLPFVLKYKLNSNNLLRLYLVGGLELNKIIDYNLTIYYMDGGVSSKKITDYNDKIGLSIFTGVNVSIPVYRNFNLNVSPIIQYMLVPGYGSQRPNYESLPEDRFLFSLSIGIEYLFHRNIQ